MIIPKDLYTNLINISYALIIAGFIIVFITTGMTNQNSLTALISGYGVLISGIFFVAILNFSNMENLGLITRIINMVPFILIMFIIGLIMTYLSIYFDRISSKKVSDYYYSFSSLSIMFLIFQIFLLFNALMSKHYEATKQISGKVFSTLMLLGVINSIIVITLGITLKFFTTQG